MEKVCNGCGVEAANVSVPYVVHESAMARMERQSKRLVEESTTISQENGNGDNNYIGNDGDINNGEADNKDQTEIP